MVYELPMRDFEQRAETQMAKELKSCLAAPFPAAENKLVHSKLLGGGTHGGDGYDNTDPKIEKQREKS